MLVVLAHPGDVDPWANDLHSFTGRRPADLPRLRVVAAGAVGVRRDARPAAAHRSRNSTPTLTLAARCCWRRCGALDAAGPGPRRPGRPRPAARASARRSTWRNWASGWSPTATSGVDAVELPGEFSRRGGILDVFSPDADDPVRLEFFGDEVESIRPFSAGHAAEPGRSCRRSRVVGERRPTRLSPAGRGPPHRLPARRRLGRPRRADATCRSRASSSSSASPTERAVHRRGRRSQQLARSCRA